MKPAIVIVIAYLLGSIPFGYVIVRATQGADVRETGSGGTGATNVSRRAGKTAGVITLLLDALKGALAVVTASWILGVPFLTASLVPVVGEFSANAYWWIAAAGVVAIVGHMFPVWLGFRGGKGVATAGGVFLTLTPIAIVLALAVFLLVVWRTRYVSLGSIIAAAVIPGFVLLQDAFIRPIAALMPYITAAAAGGILVIFAHRANIRRLVEGTESKFK